MPTTHTTTIFGGNGFVGRHIVKRLAARGDVIKVAIRQPEQALMLKPMGDVGQIVPIQANLLDAESIRAAIAGSDTVINCVGLLTESGRQNFTAIHVEGAGSLAANAKAAGVQRLVHLSAIGADIHAAAHYSSSKGLGEAAVLGGFPTATIVRPSLVVGPEDKFFNLFAGLARWLPCLPLMGGGQTKFQPIYVGDVADAVLAVLNSPATAGKIYELGGADIYSFKQLMQLMLRETGYRRWLLPIPMPLAYLKALVLEQLPRPFLTRDQLRLLKLDNVVGSDAPGLAELGLTPTAIETILPSYLAAYRNPLP
jgi:NADH dehydrogenase